MQIGIPECLDKTSPHSWLLIICPSHLSNFDSIILNALKSQFLIRYFSITSASSISPEGIPNHPRYLK